VALAHALVWQMATGDGRRPTAARPALRRVTLVAAPGPAPAPPIDARGRPPAHEAAPSAARRAPGAHGAAPGAVAARPPTPAGPPEAWPTYRTRTPPPLAVHYALAPASGPEGEAELDWTHDAQGFTLRLSTTPPGRPAREWLSTGGFDAAGLAPLRLAEREKARDRRAVNFDQAAREVRFSGSTRTLPIAPGAQDRWSWIAQLAAIAEAAPRPVAPGTTWRVQVAGLRGELDAWTLRVLDDAAPPAELPPGCARDCALLHVLKEPEHPYDLRVEAWLDPGLHHFPAGLRLSTPPSSWSLALWARPSGP